MRKKIKVLALIGARSGSKGVKNKNIRKLNSKPLMSWIIQSARKSKYINKIVVSTDSKKYQNIAVKNGAEAPFLRPKKISSDQSDEIDFIKHAINYLKKKENYEPDIIVRLLATNPFQKPKDMDKLISLLIKKKFESAVIIAKAKQHPLKALKIKKGYLVSYKTQKGIDVGKKNNRQKNEKKEQVYFRANVIACKLNIIKKYNSLTNGKVGYVIVSNQKNIDIDDEIDFKLAQILAKKI